MLNNQEIVGTIELLTHLYEIPEILAQVLSYADRSGYSTNEIDSIINFIVHGLYGNAECSKDATMVINLLKVLMESQVLISDNPRRILRPGSTSFAKIFQKYYENSLSARIFLKSALFDPIMTLLIENDKKLEIDPQKVIAMQSLEENIRMFGEFSSSDYIQKLENYKTETTGQLYTYISTFVNSLQDNWCLIPSTLRALSIAMVHILTRAKISMKDIKIILTDMIFNNFICPAILNPNICGIVDAPISENNRFNLIQIAQVLQSLALLEFQVNENKTTELLNKFDPHCISGLLNELTRDHQNDFEKREDQQLDVVNNIFAIGTIDELQNLMNLLRSAIQTKDVVISSEEKQNLTRILETMANFCESFESLSKSKSIDDQTNESSNGGKMKSKTRARVSKTKSTSGSSVQRSIEIELNPHSLDTDLDASNVVLIIPLTNNEPVKLLTEAEVLKNTSRDSSAQVQSEWYCKNSRDDQQNELISDARSGKENSKTASVQLDDASIGNVSDNLEIVSEAHSNHSVASSLELEETDQNDNDNLSDMISANVSGRGSPNISGRDTPSSQTEGGDSQQLATPQMTRISNKARSDIEDKFCKFEIKKVIEGDETVSIISDTWSTDVLSSDTEANERNLATVPISSTTRHRSDQNILPSIGNSFQHLRIGNLDMETPSESVWFSDNDKEVDITQKNMHSATKDRYSSIELSNQHLVLEPSVNISSSNIFSEENLAITNKLISFDNSDVKNDNRYEQINKLKSFNKKDKNFNNAVSVEFAIFKGDANKQLSSSNVQHRYSRVLNPFSDMDDPSCSSIIAAGKISKINDNIDVAELLAGNMEDDLSSIEHRRISSEQRNANFDSRRNGIMDVLGNFSNSINLTDDLPTSEVPWNTTHSENSDYFGINRKSLKPLNNSTKLTTSPCPEKKIQRITKDASTNSTSRNSIQPIKSSETKSANTFAAKPGKSTGAIPKSISFDSSADKINERMDSTNVVISEPNRLSDGLKLQSGFFNKIKFGFKHRRTVHNTMQINYNNNGQIVSTNSDAEAQDSRENSRSNESTEDILAKYRRKTSMSSDTTASDSTSNNSSVSKSKIDTDNSR
ncbi:receptor-mediated endocytosis protein 6 homolog [Uranotaenia lowii]|uniref:receptor-mediated endocytosis protein 6 homolog n=1 Tax=Uranotaenia lowii TaxID=190385 RepID=UPI00247ADA96|nr:receptor-mediated endocytosis protein 6 homolog [Uranotaenia lowii]